MPKRASRSKADGAWAHLAYPGLNKSDRDRIAQIGFKAWFKEAADQQEIRMQKKKGVSSDGSDKSIQRRAVRKRNG